jgi:ABC-type cobalamin/Fe3+-siderophores transport system ATPase subunit
MNSAVLHISELCIGYTQPGLIKAINLTLAPGKLYLLVGNNGTGKSTLLKTFTGELAPLSGKCQLRQDEKEINWFTLPSYERAKWMSYLPARHQYAAGLLVEDVLQIGRTPHLNQFGTLSSQDKEKIQWVITTFGLRDWLVKPLHTLSDGEQQKVRLARVVLQESPFILLDEPTSHLDIRQKKYIFSWLQQLSNEGKTIVCATHDLLSAFPFSQEIIVLQNNSIECKSTSTISLQEILSELE